MGLRFTVYGRAESQGSLRSFVPRRAMRPVTIPDNPRLLPFRQQVTRTAQAEMEKQRVEKIQRPGAVTLSVRFVFTRPTSLPKRVQQPSVRPDLDKLLRATLDALTGTVFEDDAQVVEVRAVKSYGQPERTEIAVDVVAASATCGNGAKATEAQQTRDLFAGISA